jgi:four helix bundle protein
MAAVKRFEELVAWHKARQLTKAVYYASKRGNFAKDFGLSAQIQRGAVSIMSNSAEGFERHRLPEFHQFLSVAKASCGEVRSQLYVALDVGYLGQREFEQLQEQAEEVARVIGGLRAAVAKQRNEHNDILISTKARGTQRSQHSGLSTRG